MALAQCGFDLGEDGAGALAIIKRRLRRWHVAPFCKRPQRRHRIGGKNKNRHWDKKVKGTGPVVTGKTPIIGAVTRKGNVVARVLQGINKIVAQAFVREVVSNKVSLLATDENSVYEGLKEYRHRAAHHASGKYVTDKNVIYLVNPRKKEYVVGAVHTNTIEGFWSIFKRGVVGTFHKISAEYMPLYVAEFQFRYNNRMNADIFRTAIEGC